MNKLELKNELGRIKYAKLIFDMQEAVLDFIVTSEENYDHMCLEMNVDNLQEFMSGILGDPEEVDYTALEEAYHVVQLYTKNIDGSIDETIDEDYGGKGRGK